MKNILREKALAMGFDDIGFAQAKSLEPYIREIDSRPPEMYSGLTSDTFNLRRGADIPRKHPWAKSIVVLIRNYHQCQFPHELIGRIGRAYQVDDRKEKKDKYRQLLSYFDFLKTKGIRFIFDPELPARMAAAQAGITNYGKNCFAYANKVLRGTSWIEIIPILVDIDVEPDETSLYYGCPDWCRNACMAACPTKAIYAPGKMNPRLCIAYNSYYGRSITPLKLREPMGTWIYGCDRCQQVCPRNAAYASQPLPLNTELEARAADFRLEMILKMTDDYYAEKIWPLCFYISRKFKAKWQMNAARAMGNLNDRQYVPLLITALRENESEIVRGMCAWALGKLGGQKAKEALEAQRTKENGLVRQEIETALNIA